MDELIGETAFLRQADSNLLVFLHLPLPDYLVEVALVGHLNVGELRRKWEPLTMWKIQAAILMISLESTWWRVGVSVGLLKLWTELLLWFLGHLIRILSRYSFVELWFQRCLERYLLLVHVWSLIVQGVLLLELSLTIETLDTGRLVLLYCNQLIQNGRWMRHFFPIHLTRLLLEGILLMILYVAS